MNDTTMTKANTPVRPPLDESSQTRAMAYIRKCEHGNNGRFFKNFEETLRTYFMNGFRRMTFRHTFEEYVILETILQNHMIMNPSFKVKRTLFLMRTECKYRCGANPKHHAIIYHNLVNELLIYEEFRHSFRCYYRDHTKKEERSVVTERENRILHEFFARYASPVPVPESQRRPGLTESEKQSINDFFS